MRIDEHDYHLFAAAASKFEDHVGLMLSVLDFLPASDIEKMSESWPECDTCHDEQLEEQLCLYLRIVAERRIAEQLRSGVNDNKE